MGRRKIIFAIIITTALYWIFMTKYKYPHSYKLVLQNMESRKAWEFFSDFSNVKTINPTIIQYDILSESGTGGPDGNTDWEYTVLYTEHLVHIPYIINEARANIKMFAERIENGKSTKPSRIVTEHETCMLGTCLNTTDVMEFRQESSSTVITAQVEYECQLLFSYYCKLEYLSQRALIHERIYATLLGS